MLSLIVTDRAGETREIAAEAGLSVMENIRNAGLDELMALCGGCLSCATCQVYVDADSFETLPPMEEVEADLLDSSEHRKATSRLSCQISMTDALDGLRLTIAPED